jgi:hypothetical protein
MSALKTTFGKIQICVITYLNEKAFFAITVIKTFYLLFLADSVNISSKNKTSSELCGDIFEKLDF